MYHWSDRYVGEPYVAGEADCAALAARVQREVYSRELNLPDARAGGLRGDSRLITDLQADYAVPVSVPSEGDAVLMRSRGSLSHIGVYCLLNATPTVLHAMRNAGQVARHPLRELHHYGLTIEGYYRWI